MRKIYGYLLFILLLGLLTGCGAGQKNEETEESKYYKYYLNQDETDLVKVPYEPKDESSEAMLQELMQSLSEEGDKKHQRLLPKGVTFTNQSDIHNKRLTLYFSKEYYDMDFTREILTRAGIVETFTQVPDVTYVRIMVDGEELRDRSGKPVGVMTTESFVENRGQDINSYQYSTATLYFANADGTKLIPETRNFYYSSNLSMEKVVVEQLLKGPKQSGLFPTLAANTTVLSVSTTDKECYVNLDGIVKEEALPLAEEIPIYSIVNSLVDTCGVKRVQISINGETNLTFKDTMKLDQFYTKNEGLIQEDTEK